MSTDQLGNRVVVRGGGVTLFGPHPFLWQVYGQIFKDDVNGFFLHIGYFLHEALAIGHSYGRGLHHNLVLFM